MRALDVMWVGVGGGLGSLIRWRIGTFIESRIKTRFKIGTFFINVSGAFILAYLATAYSVGWDVRYGDMMTSLVLTGVLGGYTTFSSMQLDTVQMVQEGRHMLALSYITLSVGVGLAGAALGVSLAAI